MSEDQLKAFLEKVKTDKDFKKKLESASDIDSLLQIAKDAGFTIPTTDFQESLTDKELEVTFAAVKDTSINHCSTWDYQCTVFGVCPRG